MQAQTPKKAIRYFVIDDEDRVIQTLVKALNITRGFQFMGKANSGEEAIERLQHKPVDIILLDVEFGGRGDINGIETAEVLLDRFMKKPQNERPHIVLMTKHNDSSTKRAADKLEISLIGKSVNDEKLINYLELIYEDGARFSSSNPQAPPTPERTQGLNFVIQQRLDDEQIQIACLIREGLSSTQIQSELSLDDHVVENRKTAIFKALKPLMLNGKMNVAILSALMERSGLCSPLELNDIEQLLKGY